MRRLLSFVLDILNGLPSIVIGIFIFGLIVLAHQQSAFAGGVALAIIMLPLIARSTQEVLALVPETLREASFALGVSRWRTTVGLIIPASFGGIITGGTLAIARAAGETAPLLFTCALTTTQISWDPRQPLQSIPLTIFQDLENPDPGAPRSGVGGGARALDLRARHQRPLEGRARAQQEEAHTMNEDTIDMVAPIEVAQRESTPTTHRETVFDIRGLSVLLRQHARGRRTSTSRSTATWSPR